MDSFPGNRLIASLDLITMSKPLEFSKGTFAIRVTESVSYDLSQTGYDFFSQSS